MKDEWQQAWIFLFSNGQEQRIRPVVFHQRVTGAEADMGKTGPFQFDSQLLSLETIMTIETGFVRMEGTVFLVQVANTYNATGLQQGVKAAQHPGGIRDVMQRHQHINQFEALRRYRIYGQVQLERGHMLDFALGDFLPKHFQHPERAIRQCDRAQVGLQGKTEQSGAAAIFKRCHRPGEPHLLPDGKRHRIGPFGPARHFIPTLCPAIEISHFCSSGYFQKIRRKWSGRHADRAPLRDGTARSKPAGLSGAVPPVNYRSGSNR